MTRCFMFAVVAVSSAMIGQAQAQPTYAQNQINGLYRRNSSSNYTTQTIRSRLLNRTVPQYGFSQANRGLFSGVLGNGPTAGKPFAGASGGGSVSPWLALSEPFTSSAHNYYTQVRPQLDQQRINQQMAARSQQMQRQLNSMAARGPYSITGDEHMAPTGHTAAFFNYGGYYQPVRPTKSPQH